MTRPAIHPGEHLADHLEAVGMSAAELARQIGVPTNRISEILNGRRSVTGYQILEVAETLPTIPRSAQAFEEGRISWSQLKALAIVAREETEEAWIEFAGSHTVEELVEEVRDAEESKRKLGRKGASGLMNRKIELKFRMIQG